MVECVTVNAWTRDAEHSVKMMVKIDFILWFVER